MSDLRAAGITSTEGGRSVSGFTATCVLVSNVIGSGIFTTTGFLARALSDASTISFLQARLASFKRA